jgi:TetR/AcrR family transcriptional regulator, repressor for uid operon
VRTVNPLKLEARRREILLAAQACFREKGFHGTSIAEICSEAQISAGGLYRYFRSKEDIIAAMAEDERQLVSGMLHDVAAANDFFGALEGLFDRFSSAFCDREQVALAAELLAEAARNPAFAAIARQTEMAVVADIEAMIAAGQARGQLDPTLDAAEAATLLLAAADGLGMRMVILGGFAPEEAGRALRNFVFRYLRPQAFATTEGPEKQEPIKQEPKLAPGTGHLVTGRTEG